MKSFRATWLMSVIVGALVGYTAWDYRKTLKNEGVETEEEKKLFSLASDDILEVSVQQKDELIQLKRVGAGWQMLKPVVDDAEGSAVEAFLYSTLIQKGKFFRTESESKTTNWAEFGLEPPGSHIELKSLKKTETLQVSSKNAFDGSYYVRLGDELLLGDRGLAQLVGRAPNSLRQRTLWRDTESTVERADVEVNYEGLKDKFSIVLKGDNWELEPKPKFVFDPDKVANWLVQLQRLTTQEVASDLGANSVEMKNQFLLAVPSVSVKFHLKKKDGAVGAWTFTAGQDLAQDAFVVSSTRDTVYKLTAQSLKPFRVNLESFRDGKKPFLFPVELAHQVETYSDGKLHKFTKDGSNWKLDGEGTEGSSDLAVSLIQGIQQLEAQEFLPVAKGKGFKDDQRVVVRDSKGAVIFEMSWGEPYPAQAKFNKGMTFRYAKTNLEKDAMGVSAAGINSLNVLLTKKVEKK